MSEEIKVHDKVRLRSGGPVMMVTSIGESGLMGGGEVHAYVTWFNDKNKPESASFAPGILERVP